MDKRQYVTTLDDDQLERLNGSCREYTLPRSDEQSQVKGWIRGNTKIGSVLEVKVCHHQGRYEIENQNRISIWCQKLFCYVTTTSEEIHVTSVEEGGIQGDLLRRPRQTSKLTLFLVSAPYRERKWIDMEPRKFDKS